MNIRLNKLYKIKVLRTDILYTNYLVLDNDKEFCLKIQKILPEEVKFDYKFKIWREVNLYNYLNTLNKNDKTFFTNLHSFEFCKDYKNKKKINKNKDEYINKINRSNWTSYFLLDYHGESTFDKWLALHKPSYKQTYSFIFQIIKIMLLLYKGGYSHSKLLLNNLIIKKTKDTHFKFNNVYIPYYGYQLVVCDYSNIMHKKFKLKYNNWNIEFKNNNKNWLFNEILGTMNLIITNHSKYDLDCRKLNKKLPYDKKKTDPYNILVKKIIKNHNNFWNKSKIEFTKDPDIIDIIDKIDVFDNKYVLDILDREINPTPTVIIINKIVNKFIIYHPKLAATYYGWMKIHKLNIPNEDFLYMLKINKLDELINYLYEKII